MKGKRMSRVTAGFVVLVVLVISLMLSNTLRRSSRVVLPEETEQPGQATGDLAADSGALKTVEVRPDTVQAAIATLARPESYRRTISIQQFWAGGDGTSESSVTVSGAWTRTDRVLPDGRTRRTITDGETTYIWYDSERTVYAAPAGDITADAEQSIPTYEDILTLPADAITAADYRAISDVNCIFVETAEDTAGYAMRYWVSVDSGLLVAAEKLQGGETVYRMWQTSEDLSPEIDGEFTLPDGTVLN